MRVQPVRPLCRVLQTVLHRLRRQYIPDADRRPMIQLRRIEQVYHKYRQNVRKGMTPGRVPDTICS